MAKRVVGNSRKSKKAWSGRFSHPLAKSAESFTSSVHYDVRLYKQDIVQSMAYAQTLLKARILNVAECKKIINALQLILKGIAEGKIKLSREYEDVHMNIEHLLIEKIGDVGKKLHSGRSRNDQVSTDLRMYLKNEATEVSGLIVKLQEALLDIAEENIKVIMPGYTHLQRAQPVLLSHHLMAFYEMLERDKERFAKASESADVLPLGSGALAGTNIKLDRDSLAYELGFSKISKNSMDAVSDRDFAIDFVSAAAVLMMHLSRFAEEIIIWSTREFGFLTLSDKFSTGSSIMPQKKNPDIAELIRGKTGRVYGHLMAILTVMKGLPLAYNRDMQEDKEAVFDTVDTIKAVLDIFEQMIKSTKIESEQMEKSAQKGFLTATDLAYYLVGRGVPFREAHKVVGELVAYCEESNMELEYLSLKQLKQFSDAFTYDATRYLSTKNSVANKDLPGGTAPNRVKDAIKRARKNLTTHKA
ncbi:argininosuccinate lyase [candidate division WOR-1 bacterium RIFCSPLOWO2_02_FULL_46_20]|uniref:Argininosuccinate lyase n=2 Tax=Saganbacteria TaxID=1703751 RepID=A0A1F4REP1_UNCSA|nr:MAG: argininosuccinate lyase [candidate division WOR-1 bacterium RIFCSPHIGHO2_02_FULL_45_12]OGC06647.1 MAG: argininosuccinate lyase [candidate division WOR-1 bacterium RIFCSPLOWO2_02_FULL_46_20]OGC08788.1 MAG: argininosuccinate lyase [candidate division WOR-1 bacterium RIFCSPLOWO2_12_FULL_45_9]